MASSSKDNGVALIALIAAAGAIIAVTALWVYRADPAVQTVIRKVVPAALQTPEPTPPPPTDLTPLPPETAAFRGNARPRPSAPVTAPATAVTPIESPTVVPTGAPVEIATVATPGVTPPSLAVYNGTDKSVTAPEAIRAQLGAQRLAMTPGQVVKFEYVVDTQGNVESARIVPDMTNSLGDAMLSTVALQIIRGWRFRPAVKDGVPVKFREQITYNGAGQQVPARR